MGQRAHSFYSRAGGVSRTPSAQQLAAAGIATIEESADDPPAPVAAASQPAATMPAATTPTVCPGPGLPLITKKVMEHIQRGEYVDFAELPPAKGKGKLPAHGLEGQVVVVQAADLVRSRRIIPDLATWMQCYAIYVAVKGGHSPDVVPELMAYQAIIAKASRKFKWPSWVVYDQNFRQEAASCAGQSWARAFMPNASRGRRYRGKAGAPHVRVWTTPQRTAPSSQGSGPDRQQQARPKGGQGHRQTRCAENTTNSMGTAPMAKGASTYMPAVLAGAHTQPRGATAVRGAQPTVRVDIPQQAPEAESNM